MYRYVYVWIPGCCETTSGPPGSTSVKLRDLPEAAARGRSLESLLNRYINSEFNELRFRAWACSRFWGFEAPFLGGTPV